MPVQAIPVGPCGSGTANVADGLPQPATAMGLDVGFRSVAVIVTDAPAMTRGRSTVALRTSPPASAWNVSSVESELAGGMMSDVVDASADGRPPVDVGVDDPD